MSISPTTAMASTSEHCTFCSNHHDPVKCQTYPTVSRRQDRLNELRRCYRCLKTGHIPPQCTQYVGCGICKLNSHHTALCCKNELTKDAEAPCSKNELCIFCARHYNSSDCKKIRTHQTRSDHVLYLNLCRICLNQCHPNQPCQVELSPCKFCNATTHHKALCPRNPQLDENYEADPSTGICIFCGTHNQPARCNQKDLQVRLNLLAAQGRCQKCLRHHSTGSCEYRYRCRICRSPNHHNVICPLDPSLTRSSASPVLSTACPRPALSSGYSSDDFPEPPSLPSNVLPRLNASTAVDDYIQNLANEFKARQLASRSPIPSSSSSGYGSDDSSEPEFDNTWQHADRMAMQINGQTVETRPTISDFTIQELASLMTGYGMLEASKNLRPINMPFNSTFY